MGLERVLGTQSPSGKRVDEKDRIERRQCPGTVTVQNLGMRMHHFPRTDQGFAVLPETRPLEGTNPQG